MATQRDYEEIIAKRATAQGVVTRHINSMRRALDGGSLWNSQEVIGLKQKLLDAKSKYDEIQRSAVELGTELEIDNAELVGAAEKVDSEVQAMLSSANMPVGTSSDSSKPTEQLSREDTLRKIKELQASLGASESFKSPSKEELKHRLREREAHFRDESHGMMDMINQLKSELHDLKLQSSGQQGLISTPSGASRNRVTFHNISSIHATSHDTDMRNARRSQMFDNTPLRGYNGERRFNQGNATYGSDVRASRYEPDASYALHQKMLELSEQQHRSFMASLNTPAIKLGTFSGEPLEYVAFFNNFDELVDIVEDNARVKLSKLQSHCSGKAAKAIAGCGNFNAQEGYTRARRLLKQKFGSEYVITQAWLSKLLAHPQLRTAEELEDFALDLASCKDSLYSMGYQTELKSSHTLSMIVSKLPIYLRNKWRRIHRQNLLSNEDDVVVKLVELVQEAADEMCDPVFSEAAISRVRSSYEGGVNPGARSKFHRKNVNTIQAEWNENLSDCESPTEFQGETYFSRKDRALCAGCSSSQHFTSRCKRFKELNPKEQLAFAEGKKLCIVCLSADHTTDMCRLPWKCQEKTCGMRHHTALHGAFVTEINQVVNNVSSSEVPEVENGWDDMASSGSVGIYLTNASACLPITPVIVKNGPYTAFTYALLDTGSTLTMFHERLLEQLQLKPISHAKFEINTMTSVKSMKGGICNFQIAKPNREEFHPVFEAMAVEELPITTDHMARAVKLSKWSHLKNLNLPRVSAQAVDILIGQDNAHLLEPQGKIKGGRYEPYAVLTPLGWTIFGSLDKALNWGGAGDSLVSGSANNFLVSSRREVNIPKYDTLAMGSPFSDAMPRVVCAPADKHSTGSDQVNGSSESCMAATTVESSDEVLKGSLDQFWKVESVPEKAIRSPDDRKVMELWNREFRLENNHVVLPIPYKVDPPNFPDNYMMAVGSLNSLGRRLNRNPREKTQYVAAMRKNFNNGHAIVVPPNEIKNKKYTWYLLHHNVDHPRKPDVTRVVKHGSAKHRGISLNDLTYVGPDLMNKLLAVLIRFRQFRSATTGDVENMFNMVRVVYEHQDSLRFVWWKDDQVGGEVIICRMTTHIFGTGWAPAAAMFALRKLAEINSDMFQESVIRSVLDSFYVDDWLDSKPDEAEAIATRQGVSDLLAKGSFNLCKSASNSREVLNSIEAKKRVKELATIDLSSCDSLPEECTLGTRWSPQKDAFFYRIAADPKPLTRRGLTSSVASIYDPMGMITPFVVPAKLLMQKTCRTGARWDDRLEDSIAAQWGRWLRDLDRLDGIDIPRWLGCTPTSMNTLHHIGDASGNAYGGVSYLVVQTEDGKKRSSLVMSKSRLAPVKTQSIPRLEMCAAVIATKMDVALKEYLSVPLQDSHFWSDSTKVLFMLLLDPGRLKTFMGNRVAFVQDLTSAKQWHHIPTSLNPADLLSRGVKLEELIDNQLWFHGPEFLVKEESEWPQTPNRRLADLQGEVEFRKDKPVYYADWESVKHELVAHEKVPEHVVLAIETEISSTGHLVATVEMHANPKNESLIRYTKTFSELWRSVRGVAWMKRFIQWKKTGVKPDRRIPLAELRAAELEYIKLNQRLYLTRSQIMTPGFRKLFPIDDNGVWRVGGRLDYATVSWNKKHQFLVPEDSPLASQIIRQAHRQVAHAGPERVIAETRNRYWIINGIKLAKRLSSSCMVCVRLRGRPIEQMMAPIHEDRLKFHQPPFTSTGVDLFGPLMVTVKRSQAKRYGVIYSCLTSRAVHFELAEDLSVSAFLDSMERFVARRGLPQRMHSDNGTNFVRGKKEIDEIQETLGSDKLHDELAKKNVEWKMNSPSASHQGGCWERMIRSARQIIVAITEGRNLTEAQMTTVLCRAENILNSRPLTRLSDDDTSMQPLTPNHLLIMRAPRYLFPVEFDSARYRDAWKNVQSLAASFWKRWMLYYIPELQKRSKWTRERDNLKEGELVIMVSDQYPRFTWPLAIVEQTFPGRDGRVRNVVVRTAKGTYRRPVQKLLGLEMDNG